MKIVDVARKLGKSPDFVRMGLQLGRLPFGTAVKVSEKRWSYHVSEKLLNDYLGE